MSYGARRATMYGLGFLVGCLTCWVLLLLAAVLAAGQMLTIVVMTFLPSLLAGLLASWAPRHGVHWGVAVSLPSLLLWIPAILANSSANGWRLAPVLISLGLSCLVALAASQRKMPSLHIAQSHQTTPFRGAPAR